MILLIGFLNVTSLNNKVFSRSMSQDPAIGETNNELKRELEYIQVGDVINAGNKKFIVKKEVPFGMRLNYFTDEDQNMVFIDGYENIIFYDKSLNIGREIAAPKNTSILSASKNGEFFATSGEGGISIYNSNGKLIWTDARTDFGSFSIYVGNDGSAVRTFGEFLQSCITFYSESGEVLNKYYCGHKEYIGSATFSSNQKYFAFSANVYNYPDTSDISSPIIDLVFQLTDSRGNAIWKKVLYSDKYHFEIYRCNFLENDKYIFIAVNNYFILIDINGTILLKANIIDHISRGEPVYYDPIHNILFIVGRRYFYWFDVSNGNLFRKIEIVTKNENIASSVILPESNIVISYSYIMEPSAARTSANYLNIFDMKGNQLARRHLQCHPLALSNNHKNIWMFCDKRAMVIEISD